MVIQTIGADSFFICKISFCEGFLEIEAGKCFFTRKRNIVIQLSGLKGFCIKNLKKEGI